MAGEKFKTSSAGEGSVDPAAELARTKQEMAVLIWFMLDLRKTGRGKIPGPNQQTGDWHDLHESSTWP